MAFALGGLISVACCSSDNGTIEDIAYYPDQTDILLDASISEPLALEDGYELAAKSVDVNGNNVYLELSKYGDVVDSAVIIIPETIDDTYSYKGQSNASQTIKVRFKNAFRGVDLNLATINGIWQASESDTSRVLINASKDIIINSEMPLKLEEGYELWVRSVDIDGNKVYLDLSKNGTMVDSALVVPPNEIDDSFDYVKNSASAGYSPIIRVHFKNAFRGVDLSLATIDGIWQVSENNTSRVLSADHDKMTITMNTPLLLEEDYELDIKSIDIDGKKVYVELKKGEKVVDSEVIIPLNEADDTYFYHKSEGGMIKVHFKNAFRGEDFNLAAIDITNNEPIGQQTAKDWFNKGVDLDDQGKYDEAIKAYDEAIRLNPYDANAWNNKGVALDNLGKYDEAIKAYDEAIRLDPNYALAWNNKGNILKAHGKYDEVFETWDDTIRSGPNDERANPST